MGASGRNNYPCPICKKNFEDCPHSYGDLAVRKDEEKVRKIVRDELKKLGLI